MKDLMIIGLDGGATKINGWIIELDYEANTFELAKKGVQKKYSDYEFFEGDFNPVSINTQLAEQKTGINLSANEIKQSKAYKHACLDVLFELIDESSNKKILVGIGMPGLKTKDKRGIAVLANGPRIPDLADFIENGLSKRNIELFSSIAAIGSDADFCGIGEEYASQGAFKTCTNAYYLGGGTGVADAMKLKGNLVPFDAIISWMAKTWEMISEKGLTMEKCTSARGIQHLYSGYSGISLESLDKQSIYGPQILALAEKGDRAAMDTIDTLTEHLALLLFERITTLYKGWKGIFSFSNPNRSIPTQAHAFRGELFDKIIIGQRLGDLLKSSKNSQLLYKPLLKILGRLIEGENDAGLSDHYNAGGFFREDRLEISALREAPVLGAGIDAYLNYKAIKDAPTR